MIHLETGQIPAKFPLQIGQISPAALPNTTILVPGLSPGPWLRSAVRLRLSFWEPAFCTDSLTQTNTTIQGKPKHSTSKPAKNIRGGQREAFTIRTSHFPIVLVSILMASAVTNHLAYSSTA